MIRAAIYDADSKRPVEGILLKAKDEATPARGVSFADGSWWEWLSGGEGLDRGCWIPHPDPDDLWTRYVAAKLMGIVNMEQVEMARHWHEQDPASFT